jgi:hypothetical protein
VTGLPVGSEAAAKLVCETASTGTGFRLVTTTLSISWKSVTEPVDPTQPNASCFGIPLALTQVDG